MRLAVLLLVVLVVVESGVVKKDGTIEALCTSNPVHELCFKGSQNHYHPDLPNNLKSLKIAQEEYSQAYWTNMAKGIVKEHTERKENTNTAKNIIFFIGDGLGMQTVTAARIHSGDENKKLSFEEFPYTASAMTYCVDAPVPDSACTATAYLNGVKGNYGTIGINARIPRYSCDGTNDQTAYTSSIAKWAQDADWNTGFVTNTRVTHASPAGLYANTANRNWESDNCVKYKDCEDGETVENNHTGCDSAQITDIADQLVNGEVGSKFKVILGGGGRHFLDSTITDDYGVKGQRTDGRNMFDEWMNNGKQNKKIVKNRDELMNVDVNSIDYLMGIFGKGSHFMFHLQAVQNEDDSEPTLWEMIEKALDMLTKDDKPFFLLVEGGRIDSAHHNTQARTALDETIQFHETIQKTKQRFSEEDTLIVVSADHSHTMSISGYPDRGRDILGTTGGKADDGIPYFTLNYANSPFALNHMVPGDGRKDSSTFDTSPWNFAYPGLAFVDSESHGGEDVPVYASGPWAHLFTGTIEQNVLPHLMAYAGCIGNGLTKCSN